MIALNNGHLTEYGRESAFGRALLEWRHDELEMLRRRFERPDAIMGAASFSNYWEEQVAKLSTGTEISKITGRLALCTVVPTDASTGSTIEEATYTGYARLEIAASKWTVSGTSPTAAKTNEELKFAACTAGESTVTGWAWCDASTAGNVIAWGTATSTTISTTQTPATIASGGLEITVD